MSNFTTWASTMEVVTESCGWGCMSLLYWEWEHVGCFSEQQWWKESNCYDSGGTGWQKGIVDACKHLYIQHTSTDARSLQHNSGHSSCNGKWNKEAWEKNKETQRAEAFDFCSILCITLIEHHVASFELIWCVLDLSTDGESTLKKLGENSHGKVTLWHCMTVRHPKSESISSI